MPARGSKNSYLYGSFWERLIASIIDLLILVPITFSILIIFQNLLPGLNFGNKSLISNIAAVFVAVFYNVYLLSQYETTIGKKMLKLKVVTTSYKKISLQQAFLRETVGKFVSKLILNLGYLWILIDGERQGWHDKIAKTYVVKVDHQEKLIPGKNPPASFVSWLFFILLNPLFILFSVISILVLVYLFIMQPHKIMGIAMNPTLKNNQYIMTNKLSYGLTPPKRGDIIVFKSPQDPKVDYIKRIIGLPQEVIKIENGKIYINDKQLSEPYLPKDSYTNANVDIFTGEDVDLGKPIEIPIGYYFVLGDNRGASVDSRDFGPVPEDFITGKYWFTYYTPAEKLLKN